MRKCPFSFRLVKLLILIVAVVNILLLVFSNTFSRLVHHEPIDHNRDIFKSDWANMPPHQQASFNLRIVRSQFNRDVFAQRSTGTGDTVRNGGHLSNNLFIYQANMERPFTFNNSKQNRENFPLFPDEDFTKQNDRIVNQMRYVPHQLVKEYKESAPKSKLILLYNGMGSEKPGNNYFITNNCPVKNCTIIGDRSQAKHADIIIWQHALSALPFHKRPPHQIWAAFLLESPYHTGINARLASQINWTATYRHDSTIVAPYFKFVPYDENAKKLELPKINYAKKKSKMVAWFVSNCGARNRRLEYARSLANYISLDMYGNCGPLKCPRAATHECFKKLRNEYRFYLSFENSNCRDYITEKFFLNALENDVIPIVMGAHPQDYKRQAPPNSFIHVDDFETPKHLADYLNYLATNETAYNSYFAWKGSGLVDTNTFFFCRVCSLIHEIDNLPHVSRTINLKEFWSHKNNCIIDSWRMHN